MNKFIGSGRLAKEPECRYTSSGKAVCTFTLAISEGYGDKARTTFLPVIVWDKQGEACANNLVKGQSVVVEGRVTVRDYEKDGSKHYVTEIVAQSVEFGAKPRGHKEPLGSEFGEAVNEDIPF